MCASIDIKSMYKHTHTHRDTCVYIYIYMLGGGPCFKDPHRVPTSRRAS